MLAKYCQYTSGIHGEDLLSFLGVNNCNQTGSMLRRKKRSRKCNVLQTIQEESCSDDDGSDMLESRGFDVPMYQTQAAETQGPNNLQMTCSTKFQIFQDKCNTEVIDGGDDYTLLRCPRAKVASLRLSSMNQATSLNTSHHKTQQTSPEHFCVGKRKRKVATRNLSDMNSPRPFRKRKKFGSPKTSHCSTAKQVSQLVQELLATHFDVSPIASQKKLLSFLTRGVNRLKLLPKLVRSLKALLLRYISAPIQSHCGKTTKLLAVYARGLFTLLHVCATTCASLKTMYLEQLGDQNMPENMARKHMLSRNRKCKKKLRKYVRSILSHLKRRMMTTLNKWKRQSSSS